MDIKKFIDIVSESSSGGTTAGAVAEVSKPMASVQKRMEEDKPKSPEVIEYGMWENSALTSSSKLKKSRGQSAKVVKSIYGEEVGEAKNPDQQAAIAIAKKKAVGESKVVSRKTVLEYASTPIRSKKDYLAKRKALQDLQISGTTADKKLIMQKRAELERQAKQLGFALGEEVAEGKFTVNAKTGAKLDPRTGAELPPREKPLTIKDMFRQPKSSAPKLTLDDVWRKVEDVVGQIFPDGDPIDYLAPWLEKHGIRDFKIGEILDRAAKKNGYEDLYDYYDSMKDQYARDQGVAEGEAPEIDSQATNQYAQQIIAALRKEYGPYFDHQYNRDGSIKIRTKSTNINPGSVIDPWYKEFRSKDWRFDQPVGGEFTIAVNKQQGVAEGYKEPTDAAGHLRMAKKIKKMLDDTLADRGDRHGNPDPQRLTRAYEYHMEKATEKSQGVAEAGEYGGFDPDAIRKTQRGAAMLRGLAGQPKKLPPATGTSYTQLPAVTTADKPYIVPKGEDWTKVLAPGKKSGVHYALDRGATQDPFYFNYGGKNYSLSLDGDGIAKPLDGQGVAEGLNPEKRSRLDDLIDQFRDATDPSDYASYNDPEEVIDMIRSEFGDKIADQVAAGADKMHFSRPGHTSWKADPLGWKKPVDRTTKAGRMYKQDSDFRKNTIKSRYKLSGKSATEDVEEGLLGTALDKAKKVGKKVIDIVAPDDEALLRQLQKSMGIPPDSRHGKRSMAEPADEKLDEADLIINPASVSRRPIGLIKKVDHTDHEVEMAKSDLYQASKNALAVFQMIKDVPEEVGIEGWVQEKIIKANDYLNTIREYLEGKQLESMDGVAPSTKQVCEDGVEEGKTGPGLWANIHAKRKRIKAGSGERMRKPGSKGAPKASDFRAARSDKK